jgi:hypothetical protein
VAPLEAPRAAEAAVTGPAPRAAAAVGGPGSPRAGPLLVAQRLVGNRAVVATLAAASPPPAVQRLVFARQTGLFGAWWDNDDEKELRSLEKEANSFLTLVKGHDAHPQLGGRVSALTKELEGLEMRSVAVTEYEQARAELTELRGRARKLSLDLTNDAQLTKLMEARFTQLKEGEGAKKDSELGPAAYAEVDGILRDILHDNDTNLKIVLGTVSRRDLAAGGLDIPGVAAIEQEVKELEAQHQIADLAYQGADAKWRDKATPQTQKSGYEQARKEAKEQMAEAEGRIEQLQQSWDALVGEAMRMEVMKDLVAIAQTGVGRDLLKKIARTSLAEKKKQVDIRAYPHFKAADAGEEKKQVRKGNQDEVEKGAKYVNYTPEAFRDADTLESKEGGAIWKANQLAVTNAWQETKRTDVTLFHELVHTAHYQDGTTKGDLVPEGKVADPVDAPYDKGDERRGVREEEYFTVGLGDSQDEHLTENTYRRQRAALGDDIKMRTHYVHKDAKGERAE